MNAEFEERKRRLQEQQLGTRKRLKEGCDQALRPLYSEGQALCAELASLLVGRLCRLQECVGLLALHRAGSLGCHGCVG